MRPLERAHILGIVAVMFLWSGVSFGHGNFNPNFSGPVFTWNPPQPGASPKRPDPCVGVAGPFCGRNLWYFYEYTGDSHCQEHWREHREGGSSDPEDNANNGDDSEQTPSDMSILAQLQEQSQLHRL